MARFCSILALAFCLVCGVGLSLFPSDVRADPQPEEVKRYKTGIAWEISPSHVLIYLDGKKLGEAGKLKFTRTRPGMHTIRLVKGGDEEEMDVKVNKGQVLKMVYTFESG